MPTLLRRAVAIAATLFLAACAEQGSPLTSELPDAGQRVALTELDCTVSTREKTLTCGRAPAPGDARSLILGGQGTYVFLQASNHDYSTSDKVYSIDVSVQNLIPQALGTADGTTLDAAGVRIFFDQEPVPSEGAQLPVTVLNPTGRDLFMRADQPYFQYDEVLDVNQTSATQLWQFAVDPATTRFQFKVYVAAAVPRPDGWVDLSPGSDTLLVGSTAQLASTVRSVVGNAVAGQTVTWGSSDTGIATVDASGALTAVAPGLVTISASSGARTGQATVAVCPDLQVSEAYTASMPLASSLCFSGGVGAAAEYTYMPVNLSTTASLSLAVTGRGLVPVVGPPSPAMMPASTLRRHADARARARDDWHVRRLERERRELRHLFGRPEARVHRGARPHGARALITKGPAVAVGDLMTLNTTARCEGPRNDATGRVVSVGQHVIVVADTMNPAGGFSTAQYDSIAAEFDTLAYPLNVDNFGAPTDIDSNGRVVAFYTRAVNLLTPPNAGYVVGGFFSGPDLYSSAPDSCPGSNEGEMFYLRVPDPAGVTGNVSPLRDVRRETVATLLHETQHLVNASRRIYVNNADVGEEVWLNEGLSHIAEELMFYRTSGLAPRSNITVDMLTASAQTIDAHNRYSAANLDRFRRWFERPDGTGPMRNDGYLETRGAIWSFLRYAADRRGGAEAGLWYALVNSRTRGVANLQEALGVTPTDWVRDWVAAVYADDTGIGVAAAYTNPSWDYRSVIPGLGGVLEGAPGSLTTVPLTNGVTSDLGMSPGGSATFIRFGVPAGSFAGVTALSGGAVPTTPYGFIVVRTK